MKYLYLISFLLFFFAFTNQTLSDLQAVHYEAPVRKAEIRPKTSQVARRTPTPSQIALINQKAAQYQVSAELMTRIISCESDFNPVARGDGGYSRGLVQIHASYHPDVSWEEATNEEFAVDFLAKNLSEGKGSMWTCYRLITRS